MHFSGSSVGVCVCVDGMDGRMDLGILGVLENHICNFWIFRFF